MVTVARRTYAAVVLACVCTFLMGGVVFGLSSLYPLLYRQNYLEGLCAGEVEEGQCAERSLTKCCTSQLVRLSLVSSIAFFTVDAVAVLWGEFADRRGARACIACATSLSCAGFAALCMGARGDGSDALTTAALLMIGIAGPGVFNGGFVGTLALLSDAPKLQATFTAFLAAAFDGSALVFMLFQAAALSLDLGLYMPSAAWALVCALGGGLLFSVLRAAAPPANAATATRELDPAAQKDVMPVADPNMAPAEKPKDNDSDDESIVLSTANDAAPYTKKQKKPKGQRGEKALEAAPAAVAAAPAVAAPRLVSVLVAGDNLRLVFFMAIYNLLSNFYLESQIEQFHLLFGADDAGSLSSLFNVAFPVGGFCTAFPAAALLRKASAAQYWAVVLVLALAFAVLAAIPTWGTQLAGALVFGPARCLQWACYFQFLGDEVRYPPAVTGRVLGYNNLAIAIVGDVMPYGLAYATSLEGWGGDTLGRYVAIRAALAVALGFTTSLPIGLAWGGKRVRVTPPAPGGKRKGRDLPPEVELSRAEDGSYEL